MPFYAKSVLYYLRSAPLCGESVECLKHLFLSCHYSKNLWAEVIKWLVDDNKVKIGNLSDKEIWFGIIGYKDEIFVYHIYYSQSNLYSCKQIKAKESGNAVKIAVVLCLVS